MNRFKSGWFSEVSETELPGQALSLEVEEILHQEKSQIQEILIFKSKTYGRVLVLDGSIQCTERDEFAYHEMITHLPMFSHPNPKSVLVVGGGDGGTLRELAKHSCVEEIHICEIDERVIELSKQYLPQTGVGFSSPKVHVHIRDGVEFVAQCKKKFDVIITDSSDPVGRAEALYDDPYYESLPLALKDDGVICSQADCIWIEDETPKDLAIMCRENFPVVGFAQCSVPSYASGSIGFALACSNKDAVLETPLRKLTQEEVDAMGLKYYDSDVHKAAFTLPQFVKTILALDQPLPPDSEDEDQ